MTIRRERKGIMLANLFDRDRFDKWPTPIYVQPKLEGERCRSHLRNELHKGEWNDNVKMLSSTALEIVSMPHIAEELDILSNIIGEIELDGELYSDELSFEEISSRVGRPVNLHPRFKDIGYHIFDIPASSDATQEDRLPQLVYLKKIIFDNKLKYIKIVPTYEIEDYEGMLFHLDMFIEQRYEGIILRHKDNHYERKRSVMMMKLKPSKKDKYRIIGFKEEISKDGIVKNSLGAFICVTRENSSFSVGTGRLLTRQNRNELWERRQELVGKTLIVKYSHLTDDRRVPYTPVALEIEGEAL